MTIDSGRVANLAAAIDFYRSATSAWQRRIALDIYRATATPDLVGEVLAEYVAMAPTNAELDDIAADLVDAASRLVSFGTNLPETAGYVAVLCVSGAIERNNETMAFILQDGQEVDLSANYRDRHGNPATVETQTWSSSDDTIIEVTDNGDGTATAAAVALGAGQVQLVADARYGDDVSEIRAVLDVEVVAAEAVNATITPGEPIDSPTAGGGAGTDETTPEPGTET